MTLFSWVSSATPFTVQQDRSMSWHRARSNRGKDKLLGREKGSLPSTAAKYETLWHLVASYHCEHLFPAHPFPQEVGEHLNFADCLY